MTKVLLGVMLIAVLVAAALPLLAAARSPGCDELDGRADAMMSDYVTTNTFYAGEIITVTITTSPDPVEVYFAGVLKGTISTFPGSVTFTVPGTGLAEFRMVVPSAVEFAFACRVPSAGAATVTTDQPFPTDGRICANPKAAIYVNSEDGIAIYRITSASRGIPAVFARPAELDALPDFPTQPLTIVTQDEGIFIGLYKLKAAQTETYQVNVGPDVEGKVFTCIWDGVPPQPGSVIAFDWNIYDVLGN
ncbi:MAG: hypothetical protein HZC41_11785 [Chloroflexi bacterium]|nr:hypothetical protein [Chloroflexota bacterium]